MGFGMEGAALEEASGTRGETAGQTYGVVAILHEPVWGDVAFGTIEEADDGIEKPIRGPGSGNPIRGPGSGNPIRGPGSGNPIRGPGSAEDRGQTGLPAHFRQTAPEIHGSLVSPRRVFEGGAGDAGEVAGVEVGVMGDGSGVDGEEEEQGSRSAIAENLDDLQGGVGREIARAAEGGAIGTSGAEAAAALEDGGAQGFGVVEEGLDGAIALDAGCAAPIEAQFMGAAGMGVSIGDGVDDGVGDAG